MSITTHDKAFQPQILTNFIKAYTNKQKSFIGRMIAPYMQVNLDKGQIYGYGTQGIRSVAADRAVGSAMKKVDFNVEKTDQRVLEDYGLKATVLKEEIENAENPLQAKQAKAAMIYELMMLNHEIAVASQINTTNITNNSTLSGGDQRSDYNNSTPVSDIDDAKESVRKKSGKKPNMIAMDRPTFVKLKRHPQVTELFKGAAIVTDKMLSDMLKDILGFDEILVGDAQYDNINLKDDALESGNDLVDVRNSFTLLFYSEKPTLYSTSFMKTFAKRDGLIAGSFSVTDEDRKTNKIDSGVFVEEKRDIAFVDQRCGFLFEDTIA